MRRADAVPVDAALVPSGRSDPARVNASAIETVERRTRNEGRSDTGVLLTDRTSENNRASMVRGPGPSGGNLGELRCADPGA
jgi:hypothetical protein